MFLWRIFSSLHCPIQIKNAHGRITMDFYKTNSSPNPVYLWVSKGLGGIPEFNFKGSWCKNEALGVLGAKKSKS